MDLDRVWTKVLIRMYGPFPESHLGNSHFCLIVDDYSKFSFVYPLEDGKVDSAVDYLFTICSIFGFPEFVVLNYIEDDFVTLKERFNERLEEFSKLENILWNSCLVTTDETKVMDDAVEAEALNFVNRNPTTWDQELDVLLLKLRIGRRTDLGTSPYQLMFQKEFPNIDHTRRVKNKRKIYISEEDLSDLSMTDDDGDVDFVVEKTVKRPTSSGKKPEKQTPGKQLLTTDRNVPIRPTKYLKLSLDTRDEIAKFAIANSIAEAKEVYSKKLNKPLSENSVRNYVDAFRKLTPLLKQDIGKCMVENGYSRTAEIYSQSLGFTLSKQLAGCLKNHYLKAVRIEKAKRQRMKFCETSRKLIGKYAVEHGTKAAIKEFSDRFQTRILPGTVRKFKWTYLKSCKAPQDSAVPLKDPPGYPKLPAYPGHSQDRSQRSDRVVDLRRTRCEGNDYSGVSESIGLAFAESVCNPAASKTFSHQEMPKDECDYVFVSARCRNEVAPRTEQTSSISKNDNYARFQDSTTLESRSQLLYFTSSFSSDIADAEVNPTAADVDYALVSNITPVDLSVDLITSQGQCTSSTVKEPFMSGLCQELERSGQSDSTLIVQAVEPESAHAIENSSCGAVAKRGKSGPGRRPLFAQYEPVIIEKLLQVAADGGRVSERSVLKIASSIISKSDPELVSRLSMSWVKSFLRRVRKPS